VIDPCDPVSMSKTEQNWMCLKESVLFKTNGQYYVAMSLYLLQRLIKYFDCHMLLCSMCCFPFVYPRTGPKVSSATSTSCFITGQFMIRFFSRYSIKSLVLSLPIIFCKVHAFFSKRALLKCIFIFILLYCGDEHGCDITIHIQVE